MKLGLWLILFFQCVYLYGQQVHTWEMHEITFNALNHYENPYSEVNIWIDLSGPGFNKRVFGFWDGRQTFRVRVVATTPGQWRWTSGTNKESDEGLHGKSGGFTAIPWTTEEIEENPNRRGFIRATANGHAFEYADRTPFFLSGDTWWAATTWRVPYSGVDPGKDYQPAPGITFEGLISYLKGKEYNSVNLIACYPNWDMDGKPWHLEDDNGVVIRSSWAKWGYPSQEGEFLSKEMQDELGNKPFEMSDNHEYCADYDYIIPAYFQSLDKKMHYLSNMGFVPFLEPMRRDHYHTWEAYFNFRESYSRYAQYIFSRYGAYNLIFSGIHLDGGIEQKDIDVINETLSYQLEKYGSPPFGQPVTTLIEATTLVKFGHGKECPWLNMHSAGNNMARDHGISPLLENMFRLEPPYPFANLEPRYTGWEGKANHPAGEWPITNSPRDNYFTRASMYGSVLSGGLAGHVHGHSGYDCVTTGEKGNHHPYIWEALRFESNGYMQHLRKFLLSEGRLYQDLEPASEDLSPRKAEGSHPQGLDGWSFMMRTEDKSFALLYFENDAPLPGLCGMLPSSSYVFHWFNPETGDWFDDFLVESDRKGRIFLPEKPDTGRDWAAKLVLLSDLPSNGPKQ